MTLSSVSMSGLQLPDPAEMRKKMFQKADADGNGSISKDELTNMMKNAPKRPEGAEAPNAEKLFKKIDTDGNGEISEAENNAFMDARDAERQGKVGSQNPDATSFNGSGDLVKDLLDALKKAEEDESSGSTSSGLAQNADQRQAMLKAISELFAKIHAQASQYTEDGTTSSTSGTSLFSAKV